MRALFLSLLFICLVGSARGDGPVDFDWTKFGREVHAAMPKEVKEAGPLRRIHHVAERVADKLFVLGVPPNFDEAGRNRARAMYNDAHLGTCGHTAQCLQEAWRGACLPVQAVKSLVVLKRKANGKIAREINADHVAMVYLDPDIPVVFDLWCDGRTHQTFGNFTTSIWKGMPVAEWSRRMDREGYNTASCHEHAELGETKPVQLAELLRKIPGQKAK